MKQIVDKLNKIAKKINENVELSDRDLIIDSLDSITKAYGGTPNDSTLIVDKLDDIYNNIGSGGGGGGGENVHYCTVTLIPTGEGNEKQITIDQGSNKIVNGSLQSAESEITTDTIVEVPHFSQTDKDGVTVISTYPLLFFRSTVITSTSNAVNCEWNSNDECIYITDPSENSSITINGTMLK